MIFCTQRLCRTCHTKMGQDMFEQTTFPFVGFEASSVMIFVPKDCAGHVIPRWDKTCLSRLRFPLLVLRLLV